MTVTNWPTESKAEPGGISTMTAQRDGLVQMIDQIDTKHDEGHERLRRDFRAFEKHVTEALELLRDKRREDRERLTKIETTPPNVENVIMTPKVLIAIVLFAVSIAGGIWSSTSGLRSDVRDILTRMESQKTAYDSMSKMQEVQSNSLSKAVADVTHKQDLQQFEIQELKEMILTGKGRTK